MNVHILSIAKQEVEEASDYYEVQAARAYEFIPRVSRKRRTTFSSSLDLEARSKKTAVGGGSRDFPMGLFTACMMATSIWPFHKCLDTS